MRATLLLLAIATSGCVTAMTDVPTLEPHVIARSRGNERVLLDLSSMSASPLCTPQHGPLTQCIRNFRDAMGGGLRALLSHYAMVTSSAPFAATARFRVVDFRIVDIGRGRALQLVWDFVLSDPGGHPVAGVADTTTGLEGVTALLNSVLERIGNALTAAHWPPPLPTG